VTGRSPDCTKQVERLADLVAARVAELLLSGRDGRDLIDAAEVARRFGVSRDYVYQHADELGAIRVGTGSRPRLRFNPATVKERFARSAVRDTGPEPLRKDRRPVRSRGQIPLLPVKDEER
jgi:hypothetical protein